MDAAREEAAKAVAQAREEAQEAGMRANQTMLELQAGLDVAGSAADSAIASGEQWKRR